MFKVLTGICMMAICFLLANLGFTAIDPATVSNGHVYLFDNVSGAELPDDSANDNKGIIVGKPQVVDGRKGKALKFNGTTDGIKVPDSNNMNTGGPFPNRTLIVIFNADNASKNDGKQTLFEEGGRTRGFSMYIFDGKAYVFGWNRDAAQVNWAPGSWISTPITSKKWYSLALVLRNGTNTIEPDKFEMWLNGKIIGKKEGSQIYAHGDDAGIGYTNQNTVFHDEDGTGTDRDFFAGINLQG